MKPRILLLSAGLFLLLTTVFMPQIAFAAILSAGSETELKDAILQANNTPGADTILLTADISLSSPYVLNDGNFGSSGLPYLDSQITIEGQGHAIFRSASSGDLFRIMRISLNGVVTLRNLTIRDGYANAGATCNICGAGVYNEGQLTAQHVLFDNNFTGSAPSNSGAGLYNAFGATAYVTNSTFSRNFSYVGGGITNVAGGSIYINSSVFQSNNAEYGGGVSSAGSSSFTDTTFYDNYGRASGGGIASSGNMSVMNATFDANASNDSAAILNSGIAAVGNSTFSGNTTKDGAGAVLNVDTGTLILNNSTFSNNRASNGVSALSTDAGTTTQIHNSIFLSPDNLPSCALLGTVTASNNLANNASCGNAAVVPITQLEFFANNGGPTRTFSLTSDSVALDSADDTICETSAQVSNFDQRGVLRGLETVSGVDSPAVGDCDIGSFEAGGLIRTMQFASASSSVLNIAGNYGVGISLDASVPADYAPITGYFWVSGGTALAGEDYALFGMQNLLFSPGDSTATLQFNLLPGAHAGRTIIFSFARQNGPGFTGPATLGTQLTHTVTITASTPNAAPNRNLYTESQPSLTWNPITGATGYEIQVDTDSTFKLPYSYSAANLPPEVLKITIDHPLPNGVYYWRVRAIKGTGFSAWSPVERFEILAP